VDVGITIPDLPTIVIKQEMEVLIEQIIIWASNAFLTSTASVNLFLAGVGSGKTFSWRCRSRDFITRFPEVKGGIFANTYDQIKYVNPFRIREYWSINGNDWIHKRESFGVYVSGKEPLCTGRNADAILTGSIILFHFAMADWVFTGSLDNAVMHSGKEMGWANTWRN